MNTWLSKAGLTLNLEKTKLTDVEKGGKVEFLGFELSERLSPKTGNKYIHTQPSQKSLKSYRAKVRTILNHWTTWKECEEAVREVNEITRGWGNYFDHGQAVKCFRNQNYFLKQRFRSWVYKKHKGSKTYKSKYTFYPDVALRGEYQLEFLENKKLWMIR